MKNGSDSKSDTGSSPGGITEDDLPGRRERLPVARKAMDELFSPPSTPVNGTPRTESDFNFVRHVRLALRGRYGWVVGLGILAGALCGYAGWKLGHPTYLSSGLVRIAYELPEVMSETDQNGPMQMFDTFMQSQKLLITSRQVLDVALQDPIWHTTGHDVPADPDNFFRRYLTVTIGPRSEYIQIQVSYTDPGVAAAAVNSIVNAYA